MRKETTKEAAERMSTRVMDILFKDEKKLQQERSYSEEDMREAFNNGAWRWRMHSKVDIFKEWLEQFKKK